MSSLDWLLECVLVTMLVVTLLHAIRLERALRELRRDRASLGDAVADIEVSTQHAEAGLGKLRAVTQDVLMQVSQRTTSARTLCDDLSFLIERGDQIADRLEALVRLGRGNERGRASMEIAAEAEPAQRVRTQAERDLMLALRSSR